VIAEVRSKECGMRTDSWIGPDTTPITAESAR
jgi:hypothetical protein